MSANSNRPTIARIWRGRTKPERADEYEAYNYEVGVKPSCRGMQSLQFRARG